VSKIAGLFVGYRIFGDGGDVRGELWDQHRPASGHWSGQFGEFA